MPARVWCAAMRAPFSAEHTHCIWACVSAWHAQRSHVAAVRSFHLHRIAFPGNTPASVCRTRRLAESGFMLRRTLPRTCLPWSCRSILPQHLSIVSHILLAKPSKITIYSLTWYIEVHTCICMYKLCMYIEQTCMYFVHNHTLLSLLPIRSYQPCSPGKSQPSSSCRASSFLPAV
jgi:hypothetical protein